MNTPKLLEEAETLVQILRERGLQPMEACAVMGIAIVALIRDKSDARTFVRTLAQTFDENMAKD